MMKTRTLFTSAVLLGALAIALPARAQQGTVLLTNGERVVGRLSDFDDHGFLVDMPVGDDRRVFSNQVVLIDFLDANTVSSRVGLNLSNGERQTLRNGDVVFVLKDGTRLSGKVALYERTLPGVHADLPTNHVYRVNFSSSNGARTTFLTSDISQMYLREPSESVASTSSNQSLPDSPVAGTMFVAANKEWTATGVTVRRGQTLSVQSSGRVKLSSNADDMAEPRGSLLGRLAQNAPLPRESAGALIGRVGTNGAPFIIGDRTSITIPATGQLFLGVNDDGAGDNSGNYNVTFGGGAANSGNGGNIGRNRNAANGVPVAAATEWTPTGMIVRRGETIRFQSSGTVSLSGNTGDTAQPGGGGRKAVNAPLPNAPAGALIGRIGSGQPFLIGAQTAVEMPTSGILFLGINDDGFADNGGQFTVVVTR